MACFIFLVMMSTVLLLLVKKELRREVMVLEGIFAAKAAETVGPRLFLPVNVLGRRELVA